MTNKKKIVLSIITLVFVAIAGIFGFVIANNQDLNVKADNSIEIFNYGSATLPFYISGYSGIPDISNNLVNDFFNFRWSGNTTGMHLFWYPRLTYKSTSVLELNVSNYTFDSWQYFSKQFNYALIGESNRYAYFYGQYYIDTGFNFNVAYFTLGTYKWGGVNNSIAQHQFTYYDVNGKHLSLFLFGNFNAGSSTNDVYIYSFRSYSLVSDLTDNQYYVAGRQQGLSENQPNIFDQGYQKAIEENKSIWETTGYNNGVADANTYSFLGLIGAAFDVPLNAFKSCFDFNVLGVNMKDFFFAILSFTLILFVVRLILGGK